MADGYHQFTGMEDDSSSVFEDDFDEEHVWNVRMETRKTKEFSASYVAKHIPTAAKMIPRSQNTTAQHSAPMKIPDWSKVYRKNVGEINFRGNGSWGVRFQDDDQEEDDFDEEEDGRIPPHEWAAKKLARSQVSSFSMCEGAGRTLKGRDLSKVRNSVLIRTGFLE